MDDDQAAYHNDMLQIERLASEALVASKTRTLTEDEIMAVAWMAGLTTEVYQGIRT
jgi:hypothetical protein